jgi:hypothetical protein
MSLLIKKIPSRRGCDAILHGRSGTSVNSVHALGYILRYPLDNMLLKSASEPSQIDGSRIVYTQKVA